MKQRLRLCLLAAALAGAPLPAAAQAPRPAMPPRPAPRLSHVPIEGGISPALADEFLKDRLQQAETAAEMERLLADVLRDPEKHGITTPQEQEALRRAVRDARGQPEKLLEDPKVRDLLRGAADQYQAKHDLTPEQRQRLEEFARRYLPPDEPERSDPSRPDEGGGKPSESSRATPIDPTKGPGGGPAPDAAGQPPMTSPMPPSNPPANNSPVKGGLRDMAEALADSRLAESPAFRRMIANFDRAKAPEVPGVSGWDRRLEEFGERFSDLGTRLPRFSWPRSDFSSRRPGGRWSPRDAGDTTSVTAGDGRAALLLVVLAGVALLAWAGLRRRGLLLLRRAEGRWQLGPWPVRPEAVRTRDELVRAFEYLALLLLGPAARNRNHRDIATGLAESDGARRAAADRLAGLYEQARYAPPDEVLPDADLAAARADLSLLAGVAAA